MFSEFLRTAHSVSTIYTVDTGRPFWTASGSAVPTFPELRAINCEIFSGRYAMSGSALRGRKRLRNDNVRIQLNRNTYALSALLSGKIPSREYPACYMYEMSSATVENGDLTYSAESTTQIFYILYNFFYNISF